MEGYARKAAKKEITKTKGAWTSDHWTGPDNETYMTVTAHYIDPSSWNLKSVCLDFKVFSGSTTGKAIYDDIIKVLKSFQGDGDTIVFDTVGINDEEEDVAGTVEFDTIGITDSAGSLGVLGQHLPENGKEHGYCTDHILHLVAKLAFDRKSHYHTIPET